MPAFFYSPNPPTPPAYIQPAAVTEAKRKWHDSTFYDPERSWNEWWNGYTYPTYDHEYPFGVDPDDPSKPYAPYGFICDQNGNKTDVVNTNNQELILKDEFKAHPNPSDPESPLNVYNVSSPMDPYNIKRFFYGKKPGSPWHQYQRNLNLSEEAPWVQKTYSNGELENTYWEQKKNFPGYITYPDVKIDFKDTPENFPWLHDQDLNHHYRYEPTSTGYIKGYIISDPTIPITEKIYLDSPVAPTGWQEVVTPAPTSAQ
jgi:hypothetical protein